VYELVHAERENIPVARACRVLRVSRSGYYKWLRREPTTRSHEDAVLAAEVAEVFHQHRGCYGGRESAAHFDAEGPDRARSASLE
jgi:putative transposase